MSRGGSDIGRVRRARLQQSAGLVAATIGLGLFAYPAASPSVALPHRQFAATTFLLSRSHGGALPNGPSCCASVSHDERVARVMAFESLATDIAGPVHPGAANVFAVLRRGPWTQNGSPWVPGRTVVVSRGIGGRAANGPSYDPQVSGDSGHLPTCVAFISRASNLVAGDHNGRPDAFVADLRSGAITRVSVATGGAESNGTASEVAISGDCKRVAFVSDATNLVTGATSLRRRVYVHFLAGGRSLDHALAGTTVLASVAGDGTPANADAGQISMSRDGSAIAFASAATNLGASARGVAQVWATVMHRSLRRGRGDVRFSTRLVSNAAPNVGANAASSHPSVDHDGGVVAFDSIATDLVPEPTGGFAQVFRAQRGGSGARVELVSRGAQSFHPRGPEPPAGDGDSRDAAISDGGEWVFFDSRAANLVAPSYTQQFHPPREVFRWSTPNLLPGYEKTPILGKSFSATPAEAAATSARGNYLAFESEDAWNLFAPLPTQQPAWFRRELSDFRKSGPPRHAMPPTTFRDLPGAGRTPEPQPSDAPGDPRLHQVWVRYLGPQ